MTLLGEAAPVVHEHVPRLVEVVFDELGHSSREMGCTSCPAIWFE